MTEKKYSIKHWAKDDRPREKMLQHGADALSNSELLAILIQNGTRQKSAVDLAKEILTMCKNNLLLLGRLSLKDLMKIKGIGKAKAIMIAAALELGRRRQVSELPYSHSIKSSADVAEFLKIKFWDLRHEVFAVIFLNRANKILHWEVISEGGITGTVVDPRIIMRRALEENAVQIILCHNHPSGNVQPSAADKDITKKIKEAAKLLDITLLDHLIVGEAGYYSFADEGLL
ncbi:MAG: DNA repair protein RadC [Chitinophagaceae bacterium]|nr:DNA repair protein RadC [Chitinophagaceae bacterium]